MSVAEGRVTYDSDGMLRIEGARRFVLGAYGIPGGLSPTEGLESLARAGFSLVRVGADEGSLDGAHTAGLRAWVSVGALDPEDPTRRQAIERTVTRLRDYPALLFWETVDEPAWTWLSAEARVRPEPLVATYGLLHSLDPHHLVYLNHAPTNLVSTLRAYAAATDITACDIYPVIPRGIRPQYALFPDGMQGDLLNTYVSQVGEYTDKMHRVAGPGRPVFMVLQAFAWEMLRDEDDRDQQMILYPTYEETRFMAYQAIIHGASGILYWGLHRTPHDAPFWEALQRTVRELAALLDVLSARSLRTPLGTVYHELGHSVDRGVEVLAKEHDGRMYLLACNADKNPVRVTISRLGGADSAEVIGEGRTVAVDTRGLTDDFAPFDVHVYALGQDERRDVRPA